MRLSVLLPLTKGKPFHQNVYGFALSFSCIHIKFIPLISLVILSFVQVTCSVLNFTINIREDL
jgi:hypothetical protein